jgi:hypothetical protein
MENWKNIEGFPNYQVSGLGNVRSLDHETFNSGIKHSYKIKGRVLKPIKVGPARCQYLAVVLCNKGKKKQIKVHILVARAFLGSCPEGKEIDHRDGNPFYNKVKNLQYLTPKENVRKGKVAKLTQEQANEIRTKYASGNFTKTQLAQVYKVSRRNINFICNDKSWVVGKLVACEKRG